MKRLKESPITTMFGMLMIAALLTLVFLKIITMEAASGFLVAAGAVLFSDDKAFIKNFMSKGSSDSQDQSGTQS
jgi:hypothetical protein